MLHLQQARRARYNRSMEDLRSKLHLETAPMSWRVLAPFFARGQLLWIGAELSLLDAAVAVAQDDSERVQQWMAAGYMAQVSDAQAMQWNEAQAELWAVVVRPFVLVQDQASRAARSVQGS